MASGVASVEIGDLRLLDRRRGLGARDRDIDAREPAVGHRAQQLAPHPLDGLGREGQELVGERDEAQDVEERLELEGRAVSGPQLHQGGDDPLRLVRGDRPRPDPGTRREVRPHQTVRQRRLGREQVLGQPGVARRDLPRAPVDGPDLRMCAGERVGQLGRCRHDNPPALIVSVAVEPGRAGNPASAVVVR